MKIREIIKLFEQEGWPLISKEDNQRQYRHPYKDVIITICFGKLSDDLAPTTLSFIMKHAQIWNEI